MNLASKLSALVAGITFGLGLVISGMTDPLKVIAFLKLAPGWNPALIFVMGSALLTSAVGFAVAKKRAAPFFAELFLTPTKTDLDTRLLVGAGLFGVGWGLAGYCPGPAIVGAFTLDSRALAFMLAFLVGLFLHERFLSHLFQATTTSKPVGDG